MSEKVYQEARQRMEKAIEALRAETAKLRTGRANIGMLGAIRVDYYGTQTPLNQMATLGVPDPRTITIQPWDHSALSHIERAIQSSDLGLTPNNDAKIIRIVIPSLNEERRRELVRVLKKHAEDGRVSVRNARRHANEEVKKLLKGSEITEDDEKKAEDRIQKMTDDFGKKIDEIVSAKEKDIMEV